MFEGRLLDMENGSHYQSILFPERAESLGEYQGYKVFLDFWEYESTVEL